MSQTITARFIERLDRTPTVASFRFALPQPVDFIPGQFARVIFDGDDKNNTALNKYLSFSCAPGHDYVEFTKRSSDSEFSQRLTNLKPGGEVLLQLPIGSCVFKDDYAKIGFLAGGIGITPAIAIIEHIVQKNLPTEVVVLYSNRSEDEIAFKGELDRWQAENPRIKVCYTVSCKVSPDSSCREGSIDTTFCATTMQDVTERKIFIYGPPKMVDAMRILTRQLGCKRENVLLENFIGY